MIVALEGARLRRAVLGHPEVQELDPPAQREDDVGRRHVTVDDVERLAVPALEAVDILQRPAHFAGEMGGSDGRHPLAGGAKTEERARDRRALDVFEDQKQSPLRFAEVVRLDDVRMVKQPQHLGLGHEQAHEGRVVREHRQDSLHHHGPPAAARQRVGGLVDLRHPAHAEELPQLVPAHLGEMALAAQGVTGIG